MVRWSGSMTPRTINQREAPFKMCSITHQLVVPNPSLAQSSPRQLPSWETWLRFLPVLGSAIWESIRHLGVQLLREVCFCGPETGAYLLFEGGAPSLPERSSRQHLHCIFIEHNGRDRGDVTAIVTKGALLFNERISDGPAEKHLPGT